MKYTVYYNVPMRMEFDSDAPDRENLESHALWWARNKSGAGVSKDDITQILPEGTASQLLRDLPSMQPHGPGGAPPTGPKAPAGDQMLARAA